MYVYIFLPKFLCRYLEFHFCRGGLHVEYNDWVNFILICFGTVYLLVQRLWYMAYSLTITFNVFSMYLFKEIKGNIIWFLCIMYM
jgi:hypothetical protein